MGEVRHLIRGGARLVLIDAVVQKERKMVTTSEQSSGRCYNRVPNERELAQFQLMRTVLEIAEHRGTTLSISEISRRLSGFGFNEVIGGDADAIEEIMDAVRPKLANVELDDQARRLGKSLS